jgi:predicted phosphodiesterase
MATALISDLHLGAWQLNDLLRYPFFIERLTESLEGVDEVYLLGDILELRFQRLELALQAARPFFAALGDTLRGRRARNGRMPRIVFVGGNHDYHFALQLMEREQEMAIERGETTPYKFSGKVPNVSDTLLLRQLRGMVGPGVAVEFAYPYVVLETAAGPALAMHGHYLDLHLASPAERLLAIIEQALTAYRLQAPRPGFDLYEAVLRPQNELLYWIGQSPAGAQVQSEIWRRLRGDNRHLPRGFLARLRRIAIRRALRAAEALAGAAARQITDRVLKGDVTSISPARGTGVAEGIQAFMDSLYALQGDLFAIEGWHRPPAYVIFGHTHRPGPLPGVDDGADTPWRAQWAGQSVDVLNTGSWLYDVERALTQEYHETHWPGTLVLIPDGGAPRVISVLKDLSADKLDELTDTEPASVPVPARVR